MRRFIFPTVLALIVAACGTSAGDDTTTTTTVDDPTTTTTTMPKDYFSGGATDAVLVIEDEGGFAPVEFLLNRLPGYVLYGDGTLLSPAPTPAIFPGPILAPVQSVQLTASDLADLARLVDAIGLPDMERVIDDSLSRQVADATTTIVTYVDPDGMEHVYGVYALGLVTDGPTDTRSEALTQLLQRLDKAATSAEDVLLYEPAGIQLWLQEPIIGADVPSETLPWPLSITPDDFEPEGEFAAPCHVLIGEAAATALQAFESANSVTVWDYQGEQYRLVARPLLPGEPGCIP